MVDKQVINNADEWRNRVNRDLTAHYGSFNEDLKKRVSVRSERAL